MLERMTALAGTDEETRTFPQIALEDYLRARGIAAEPPLNAAVPAPAENSVAVVYAEGEIVNGVGSNADVGGQWFSRALRELRGDDAVKAVVLRVNSPGGSVFASEQIRREAELLARTKPLVVSMGDVAASGGYWISVPAEKVFADPLTVTGSIGVFGVLFNLEKLGEKIGVASAAATTGPFAELDTLRRAKTPAEMAVFQKATEDIYGKFLRLVADARGMSVADVDAVAQGQVWTGLHAKTLNLVDESRLRAPRRRPRRGRARRLRSRRNQPPPAAFRLDRRPARARRLRGNGFREKRRSRDARLRRKPPPPRGAPARVQRPERPLRAAALRRSRRMIFSRFRR